MLDPMRDRTVMLRGVPVEDMRQLKAAAVLEGKTGPQYMAELLIEHAHQLRKQNGNGKK